MLFLHTCKEILPAFLCTSTFLFFALFSLSPPGGTPTNIPLSLQFCCCVVVTTILYTLHSTYAPAPRLTAVLLNTHRSHVLIVY